jgi:putative colanic acid biosynthesis UDP-glucose lipid carrier transferase
MSYIKRDFSAPERLTVGPLKVARRQSRSWAISYAAVTPLAMLIDALIIFSASVLSGLAYQLYAGGSPDDLAQYGALGAMAAVLFIAVGKSRNRYNASELLTLTSQVRQTAIEWIAIFLFLAAIGFAMKMGASFSRGATIIFLLSGLAALIVQRILWRVILADGLAVRKFSGRKIALIADQEAATDSGLLEALSRHGLQLAHHFILPGVAESEQRRKAVIAEAISSIRGSDIEEVVVSANLAHWPELNGLFSKLRVLPIPVNLVPVGPASDLFKLPSHTIGDTVTIELQRGPRTWFERFVKRTTDLVIAGAALFLLFPLILLTAIAIKLDSPGPVLFKQRRCGFNGRQFYIYKFRSMTVLEDGDRILQAQPNDNRITGVGSWLRRMSIDELPQLLNVLGGEMSIVGPRPHAVAHDDHFDKLVGKYAYRHHVKPGITGLAQVKGYRGQTRTMSDIEQRIALDLWYIDNWSLGLDFKILLMTVIEIFQGRNAY